ncbi:hypothetical protein ACHQM5_009420 [Ranunculus cassubicifolius]
MAANSSRSASATAGPADSYLGSLISLTSKSEIRYEGVLYNINTEESSIGLRNVRAFGTEGRKKDGPQVLPSEKVYEYILFRGSDIKDLQVKQAPQPVQPAPPPIHEDPAIIQSHYSRPPPMPTSIPSIGTGSVPDMSSHPSQIGLPRSTFQGGVPLYQPGGNLGSWGSSPPPPMYWQGFYGHPNGLQQMQQQPLLRPPQGMPMSHTMQQPMQQYTGMNSSLPTGTSNFPSLNLPPSTVQELPPLLPPVTSGALNTSSTLPSTLAPGPGLAPASAPSPAPALPNTSLTSSLPLASSLATSSLDMNPAPPNLNSNKPKMVPVPSAPSYQTLPSASSYQTAPSAPSYQTAPSGPSYQTATSAPSYQTAPSAPSYQTAPSAPSYQTASQSYPTIGGPPSSSHTETSTPALVTPGQLLQPGPTTLSTPHSTQPSHKDVEVVQPLSSEPPAPTPSVPEVKSPILPLPTPHDQKLNGGPQHARNNNYHYRGRGRGRGNGILRPVTKFTEEFDFTAMNEKFNKDEVWGDLGKTSKKDGSEDDEDYYDDADYAGSSKSENKPVYVKDDFFDTLSCNSLDQGSRGGRTKFSEQRKIDTETFGDFPRHWGGRGGRGGPSRGGRSRGPYYGRGYGYAGRGRGGQMMSSNRPN